MFGASNTKLIFPPAEIRHKEPEITPAGDQYAPPVVQPPDTRHPNTQFMTRKDRFEDKSFKTPAPPVYSIKRDITQGTHKMSMRWRHPFLAAQWDNIPQLETPPPGEYTELPKERVRAGYISVIGHHPYDEKEDRPLAFRTQHSSLVNRSFNSHYFKSHT
jgi:hypothetical protein